ncbi:transcriptional regulator [Trichoderma arundinaceum]|uniref:Transcriptional regulator n=1 Tax=Trichoderma arundinaceum TaxID=490622 RepID=A0A395NJZ7_TRIAR|nr:transcriptional regulator [Trichoderma arundinaceum]
MFLPPVHNEPSIPVLRKLIRDSPLGVLTTAIPSDTYPLIQVSHIPFVLDVEDESSETELGTLRGHMARQNPQSRAITDAVASKASYNDNVLEQEVLVLFTAPAHHYVPPAFYVETKPTTAKVAPTWNYAAVQAYGMATVHYDYKSKDTISFLSQQLHDLSNHSEKSIMGYTGKEGRPEPWEVAEAPERWLELMKKNIIGIEISITRLEGKFKMSQEMRKGDRDGVIQGFQDLGSETALEIARMVRERGEQKDAARNSGI